MLNGELEVVIEDRIKNGSQSSQLTWRMLTPANVEQVAGGFILRKEDKTLFVELPKDVLPFAVPATPDTDYDEPNSNITIIGYKVNLMPNVNQSLVVRLKPEQVTDKSFIKTIADKVANSG